MEAILTAQIREESGKEISRRLRAKKQLPAILYGKNHKKLVVDEREVQKLLNVHGMSRLIKLRVENPEKNKTEEHSVLIKDAQFHPVKGNILHLDLYEVSLDHKVTLKVPLVITGEEDRVNDGSIIEQMLYEIEISCLPTEIPEKIEVDVSGLKMNEVITAGDLKIPEGVDLVTSPEEYVVSASSPKVELPEAEEKAEEGEEAPSTGEGTDKEEQEEE